MNEPRKFIAVSDREAMTPQERADVIDASIVRSWDEVPPAFRDRVIATARESGEQRRRRG